MHVVIRLVLDVLEFLNRLARLGHDLFMLRELRLSPYPSVVGIFRVGRCARGCDRAKPRVLERGGGIGRNVES